MISIKVSLFIFMFLLAKTLCQNVDWCNMQNCEVNEHIACDNNGSWYSSCDSQYEVPLSDTQKQLVLDEHNKYRNQIAIGNVSGYSGAIGMAKIAWDDELAYLADLNTKQCAMIHDLCRNTLSFSYVGQNLALLFTYGVYSTERVVKRSIEKWFLEYSMGNMTDIYNLTQASVDKGIGHFTQVVQEECTKVGCAVSSFLAYYGSIQYRGYLMACNYSASNMKGCPVYRSGNTGANCKTGTDITYPGLCSEAEVINPNQC